MLAKDRKFGIEIECFVPRNTRGFQTGAYHRGLQISECPNGWNGQRDCSLSTPTGYRAIEVVSPPMAGLEGLGQIYYVVELLQSAGAIVNNSCGLHIHVEGKDAYNEHKIDNVVRDFQSFENLLFSLCGRHTVRRMNNSYCSHSRHWTGDRLSDRYRSLNLVNMGYGRKQTFEFRLFAADLDVFYILTSVYAVVALVNESINSTLTDTITREQKNNNTNIFQQIENFVEFFWTNESNLIISDEPTDDIVEVLKSRVNESLDYILAQIELELEGNQLVSIFAR